MLNLCNIKLLKFLVWTVKEFLKLILVREFLIVDVVEKELFICGDVIIGRLFIFKCIWELFIEF